MAQSAKRNRPGRSKERTHDHKATSVNPKVVEQVQAAVAPLVEEAGLYLENVKVGRTGGSAVVKVVVDLPWGPGGVDSDRLTDVSRAISTVLDDADLVQGAYTLEVSTPGAERTLTEPRHFSRAEGRMVSFRLTDGEVLTARLIQAKGATLNVRTQDGERSVELSNVASACVQVELGKADDIDFDEA